MRRDAYLHGWQQDAVRSVATDLLDRFMQITLFHIRAVDELLPPMDRLFVVPVIKEKETR